MEKQTNLPKLRFPEFQDAWIDEQLNRIATKIGDGIHGTPKYNEDGEYFFINGNNLVDGHIYITENTKRIDYEEFRIHRRDLNERTILLSINGTIGNLAYYNGEAVILGKSAAYINIDNRYDLTFSYYSLMTNKVQSYFDSELTGTTIKNLSLKTIRSTKLFIPTLPEQQKIASFFTAIDQKISQLKRKKSLLEQYKKGVMQKIFSQEIRFKDDNGQEFLKWEKRKLGDLCKKAQSGGTPKSTIKEFYDGNIPFLAISDMTKQGKYLNYTTKSISQKGINNSSSWIVPRDSLIYSMYASVGFVSINKIPIATSQAVMNILLDNAVELEFAYYYLFNFQPKIHKYVETGTQGNINAEIVKNLPFYLPKEEEQTKIANFLSAIDDKINHTQKQIEKAEVWEKGLMQQMFV